MSKPRVRYQTVEFGDTDVHLRTLRDTQQFDDVHQRAEALGVAPASWALFGVLWESGEILARLMHAQDITGLRVLEVGCGLGLASIVLSLRNADITATDHNPEVAPFLAANAALNGLEPIAFVRAGWSDDPTCDLGTFDLIIGSDLLYEADNIKPLGEFIWQHAGPGCAVIIVDPGRGLRGRFTRRMCEVGFQHESSLAVSPEVSATYHGQVLRYTR